MGKGIESTINNIVTLDHPDASIHAIVGGKGANLGKITKAGFRVPAAFIITTAPYREFLKEPILKGKIEKLLNGINYESIDDLETQTAKIRQLIDAAKTPEALAVEISEAYSKLGADSYVAVRSSGTAEDLAGTSFAGQHDTYLDVHGSADVIQAIKRCWASLWTARATGYRQKNGFDHFEALLAVVVQTMVASEVSGVMFTGNPITTATDEIVINASWGLGESVVSGAVIPDEYVVRIVSLTSPRTYGVRRVSYRIREKTLGSKATRIVRNHESGIGVLTEIVAAAEREKFCLSDNQIADLSALGCRIQSYYNEIPQDIEWGYSAGQFYLLQSRPITGVEFTWDADLDREGWQIYPDDEDILWTDAYSAAYWTGPCTPLMYSIRGDDTAESFSVMGEHIGYPEITNRRSFKFHKSRAYHNAEFQRLTLEKTWPTILRKPGSDALIFLPQHMHEEALKAPFSYADYLLMHIRLYRMYPGQSATGVWKMIEDYIAWDWDVASAADLQSMSDHELIDMLEYRVDIMRKYNSDIIAPWLIHARDALDALDLIVAKWYDGKNPSAFQDIISGSTRMTKTPEESAALFEMSEVIRNSKVLSDLFRQHEGAAFFRELGTRPEGQGLLAMYREFIKVHGHRGMGDRDLWWPRRADDPSIDYRMIKLCLDNPASNPKERDQKANERREAAYSDVLENLAKTSFGSLKAQAFKFLYDWVHHFFVVRDDERWSYERGCYVKRRVCVEMGRRLKEYGLTEAEDDVWFLGREEIYAMFDRRANLVLTKAKLASRRRVFERVLNKEWVPPRFIQYGKAVSFDTDDSGGLHGSGMSSGATTAKARVVKQLSEIGSLQKGEILICEATDPGWTSAFSLIAGIVTESGGLLSHASCLSREYGLPCVQLPGALALIPDGATITINGETGVVTIVDDQGPPAIGDDQPRDHQLQNTGT